MQFLLELWLLREQKLFAFNKMRGRLAEDSFEMSQRLQGHEVRKIHKGGDFVVQKGRRGKPTTLRWSKGKRGFKKYNFCNETIVNDI